MKHSVSVHVAAVLFGGLCLVPPADAGELTAELDCAADPRLLNTHFAPYGHSPAKSVTRGNNGGVRIRLPAATRDVSQTGLYSYVVLAGDFEFSANYEWIDVTPPKGGYGVSCGIVVDVAYPNRTLMSVSLARTCRKRARARATW